MQNDIRDRRKLLKEIGKMSKQEISTRREELLNTGLITNNELMVFQQISKTDVGDNNKKTMQTSDNFAERRQKFVKDKQNGISVDPAISYKEGDNSGEGKQVAIPKTSHVAPSSPASGIDR